jgi:hypothetical protein
LRCDDFVLDKNYQYLEEAYNAHEAQKHDYIAHTVGDTKP